MTKRAVGTKVVIRKLERKHERMMGPIIIPERVEAMVSSNSAEVLSLTDETAEASGLKVGDRVIYDALSVFDDTQEEAVTNWENVIARVNDDGTIDSIGDTVLTCQIITPAKSGDIVIPDKYVKEERYHVLSHGLAFTYKSDVPVGAVVSFDTDPKAFASTRFTYSPHNRIYIIIERKALIAVYEE